MGDGDPIDGEIESLYGLLLAEFVGARNALAAKLNSAGDAEGAKTVRALPKPSVSAWVVNRLYRDDRGGFARLIAAGARLREMQRQGGGGGDLQAAIRERRDALLSLRARAEATLAGAGQATSRSMLRRIEATLEAIATLGDAGSGQTLGRLTVDLEPPGFDALLSAAVTPDASRRGEPSGPADTARRVASAEREAERRRAAADAARTRVREAEAALRDARTAGREARRCWERAERDVERAESAFQRARADAERAGESLARAEQAVRDERARSSAD